MEKEKKSVSKLLDKAYGGIKPFYGGKRGKFIHKAYSKYYKKIFKTVDRDNKLNYRLFSERLTKAKCDVLAAIKMNSGYELYYEDVKVLLNVIHKEIRQVGKALAKENYNIIIPKEIEIELFGGEISFEVEAVGKIGGFNIPAQVDCLIEIDQETFIVRDFKSYERETEDDPMNPESQHHRAFMQVYLYAIIFEKVRHQHCKAIQLVYFPTKIISYEFTDDLRNAAKKFAMDTAFEGFEGISFQFPSDNNVESNGNVELLEEYSLASSNSTVATTPPNVPNGTQESSDYYDEDSLGWINTIKGKPLQLIWGRTTRWKAFYIPIKHIK